MANNIPERLLQKHLTPMAYFAPDTPPIAREAVLSRAIDFEYNFQRYMLAMLQRITPEISDSEFDEGGVFAEPGMLSSLSKCLRLAKALRMVSGDEYHDIQKLVKLRNMYAHGRTRVELRDDTAAKTVLYSMKIYINNKMQLDSLDPGRAFFCCVDFLLEAIDEKRQEAESR